MKRIFLMPVFLLILACIGTAQTPGWDHSELADISRTRVQKFINTGTLFVDEHNLLHAAFLESGTAGGVASRNLYYSWRNHENEWSRPERIEIAGERFNRPNVIVSPRSERLAIFGDITGFLYMLTKNQEGEWQSDRIPSNNYQVLSVNAAIDGAGYLHIAGITEVEESTKIIYLTDINGQWENFIIQESEPNPSAVMSAPIIRPNDEGRVVIGYNGQEGIYVLQNRAPGHDVWRNELIQTVMQRDYFFDLALTGEIIHLVTAGQDMWGSPWRQFYFTRYLNDETWRDPELINPGASVNNPTMTIDHEGYVHIVGIEISGNLHTGELRYMTNRNQQGDWVVSNPFDEYSWSTPYLLLDGAGEFQLLKVKTVHIQGTEYEHEVSHLGAGWEAILPVPYNLSAEADSVNVILNWSEIDIPDYPPIPLFQGYNLYRGNDDINFELINEEPTADTTYIDSGLNVGVYHYYLTGVYEDGLESKPSPSVQVQVRGVLPAPQFDPPAGEYYNEVEVTISMPDGIGSIYYTDDGSEPDADSKLYQEAIMLTGTTTLKARGFHPDYFPSQIASAEYKIETTSTKDIEYQLSTKLSEVAPNPFNPETRISFTVGEPSPVKLEIFNVKGQIIKKLVDDIFLPGEYSIIWNGKNESEEIQASGVYFVTMKAGGYSEVRGIVLLK